MIREVAINIRADDRDLPLERAIADYAGCELAEVLTQRVCLRCGSTEHGKPRVAHPLNQNDRSLYASTSRAHGLVATAVTDKAEVGIDLEWRETFTASSREDAALHALERVQLQNLPTKSQAARRAVLWCAKEAVLKATGWGLNVDPALLRLKVGARGGVTLVEWPAALELRRAPSIRMLDLAPGYVAALAILR